MTDQTAHSNSAPTNGHSPNNLLDNMSKPAFDGKVPKPVALVEALSGLSPNDLDDESQAALREWATSSASSGKKAASKKPGKLYSRLFGGKPLSQEQLLRQSLNTIPHFAPQSVLGLLQKKIKGAENRITGRKIAIQELRSAVKTGVIAKKGRMVAITPAEKRSLQQKKLHAEVELIRAKHDLVLFKQNLMEALAKNAAPIRDDIKSVRELAHIRRMAPSLAKQITDYVEKHNDVKEVFLGIKNETSADDVPNAFLDIVKKANAKTFDILSTKPKLATQVRQRVFEQLTK